jgi:uncharacterized protein YlbG (UPF0298 family)
MITEKDIEHFMWIHNRIVNVYKESENVDYLIKMRELINKIEQVKNCSIPDVSKRYSQLELDEAKKIAYRKGKTEGYWEGHNA